MRHFRSGLCCIILLFSTGSKAEDEPPAYLSRLSRSFNSVGVKCPERLWPHFTLARDEIVFVDRESSSAWVWNALNNGGRITKTDFSALGEASKSSDFNFYKRGSRDAMSLSLAQIFSGDVDYGTSEVFKLGIHEAFHWFSQQARNWPPDKFRGRYLYGEYFPGDSDLHLNRRMVLQNLIKAFAEPWARAKYLGQAAFWQARIDKRNPEYINLRIADVIEGSAQFVETVADVIANHGCETTWQKVRDDLLEVVTDVGYPKRSADSYLIGAVAGLVMTELRASNWQAEVEKGRTPAEVLLSKVIPKSETMPKELSAEVNGEVGKNVRQYGKTIKNFKRMLNQKSSVMLSVSESKIMGSYSTDRSFIIIITGVPTPILLKFNATFAQNGPKANNFKLENITAIKQAHNACGRGQYVIPIGSAKIFHKGDNSTVRITGLNRQVNVTLLKSQDTTYACVK